MNTADLRTLCAMTMTTIATLAAIGCGGSKYDHETLSPGFVMKLQNKAGCLDMSSLMKEMGASKEIRATIKDIRLVKGEQPVSARAFRDVAKTVDQINNTGDSMKKGWSSLRFEQDGCKSLRVFEGKDESTVKFTKTSPTMLAWDATEGSKKKLSYYVRLISDHSIETVSMVGAFYEHECPAPATEPAPIASPSALPSPVPSPEASPVHAALALDENSRYEFQVFSAMTLIQWGENASKFADVQVMDAIRELKRRAGLFNDPAQTSHLAELESQYCASMSSNAGPTQPRTSH